jgi:RNA polymerase sigma-70 factor, ECF subfamily
MMAIDFQTYGDTDLFLLMQKKDQYHQEAFAELYSRHSPRVFAYCRRYLGSEEAANDVFQESFVRFFKSAESERVMTNVPAFLLRIARNLCVNYLRKEKRHISFEEYMTIPEVKENEDKGELLDLIKEAIASLPEKYREVFVLREYEGLSYIEIAEMTEETVANIKVRIYRAKQKLREILAPYIKEMDKM